MQDISRGAAAPEIAFPAYLEEESDKEYLGRIFACLDGEMTAIRGQVGMLEETTQKLKDTKEKLQELERNGAITPRDFNGQARVFNDAFTTREQYEGLVDRVKAVDAAAEAYHQEFEGFNKTLNAAKAQIAGCVALNIRGLDIRTNIEDKLEVVGAGLDRLEKLREEVTTGQLKSLPTAVREEANLLTSVYGRLANGGRTRHAGQRIYQAMWSGLTIQKVPLQDVAEVTPPDDSTKAKETDHADGTPQKPNLDTTGTGTGTASTVSETGNVNNADDEEDVFASVPPSDDEHDDGSADATTTKKKSVEAEEEQFHDAEEHVERPKRAQSKYPRFDGWVAQIELPTTTKLNKMNDKMER